MSQEIKTAVEKMNQELLDGQNAYYSGNPIMSDAQYDTLEGQLSAIVTKNPQYSNIATTLLRVGVEANSVLRIPHAKPMLSIENYYTEESFVKAIQNYGAIVLVEPKRDGCSCELTYIDGKLLRAVSRGDGNSGEDQTAQVKVCKKIPQKIKTHIHDLRIRGEIVMCNSELTRINSLVSEKTYANSRNLVAGTLKQKDLTIVKSREISLIPWDVYSPEEDNLLPDSAYDRMQLVSTFGFSQYEGEKIHRQNSVDIIQSLHKILAQNELSDITADGVVVKTDSYRLREKLGVGTKFSKFQHCFKPQNQIGITYLRSVEWNVGRTGKVTPVGIVDPVTLGGATITRVTLNNETWIQALGLKINSKVELIRSGDCIPLITAVLDD
jgi:DNA ligase (NAD+)